LVAPLLLLLALNFVLPIRSMLLRSVRIGMSAVLPGTAALLRDWRAARFRMIYRGRFVTELRLAHETAALSAVANRLNYDINGFRTLLFRTARALGDETSPATLDLLVPGSSALGPARDWAALKHASGPYELLPPGALDRRLTADGAIARTPANKQFSSTCSDGPSGSAPS
jgi:putative spermidine/putrescine transport system permease protein